MITEIRLSQIKDTYTGNETILIPLIELLKDFPMIPETILLYKSQEWIPDMQVYEPFPIHSYFIKALKLAHPNITRQSRLPINAWIHNNLYDAELEALVESSKLKVLISKGDKFITAYANNITKERKSVSQLSQLSELVNSAEVGNDPE